MKTVKVFISSTFKDMNAERDVLIKNVFPRLREWAEEALGVLVQEVDLRWGVTEEQARKGQVLDLCLEGIDECKPYFLCMLGKRYGWTPAPNHIRKEVFEELTAAGSSLDEDEKKLLRLAYAGSLNERVKSLDIRITDEHKDFFETMLQSAYKRTGSDQENVEALKDVVQRILEKSGIAEASMSITEQEIRHVQGKYEIPWVVNELDKRMADAPFSSDQKNLVSLFYQRDGSEPNWYLQPGYPDEEKRKLALLFKKSELVRGYHSFFLFRKDIGEDLSDYIEKDAVQVQKLASLKRFINEMWNSKTPQKPCAAEEYFCSWNSDAGEGHYPVENLEAFGERVFHLLQKHMLSNEELKQDQTKILDDLAKEQELHARFIDMRTYNFRGREQLLKTLEKSIYDALDGKPTPEGNRNRYLMVTGQPGSGKSALLAKLYLNLAEHEKEKPSGALILFWFVGASTRSTNTTYMLHDFCSILIKEFNIDAKIPGDPLEIKQAFSDFLMKADRKVIILIDAVNQFQNGVQNGRISWLPEELPENTCIIISLVEDLRDKKGKIDIEADKSFLDAMRKRRFPPHEILVKRLSEDEKRGIVSSFLRQYNKNLSKKQEDEIIGKGESYNPLFLQVALEELRMVSRYEELPEFISNGIKQTAEEMFGQAIERIEQEMGQRYPQEGSELFKKFMIYIFVGRNGMSEEDLRLLLGKWRTIDKDAGREERNAQIEAAKLPQLKWSELRRSMRAYLFLSGDYWNFFHRQLQQAVGEKYLNTMEKLREAHSEIADFFEAIGYQRITVENDVHALKELPYHLSMANRTEEIDMLLSDIIFLDARLSYGDPYSLLDDYCFTKCSKDTPSERYRDFIFRNAEEFQSRHNLLFSLAYFERFKEAQLLAGEEGFGRGWTKPWIRTEPIILRFDREPESTGEAVCLEGVVSFQKSCAVDFAASRDRAFIVIKIGQIGMIDTGKMRLQEETIETRALRPMAIASSDDAQYIVIAYENGEADVKKIEYDQKGNYLYCTNLTVLSYLLPDFEAPVMFWDHASLWYQQGNELIRTDFGSEGYTKEKHIIPPDYYGELNGAAVCGVLRVFTFRRKNASAVVCVGQNGIAVGVQRYDSDVCCICSAADRIAIAYSDHTICVYSSEDGFRLQRQSGDMGEHVNAFIFNEDRLLGITNRKAVFIWDFLNTNDPDFLIGENSFYDSTIQIEKIIRKGDSLFQGMSRTNVFNFRIVLGDIRPQYSICHVFHIDSAGNVAVLEEADVFHLVGGQDFPTLFLSDKENTLLHFAKDGKGNILGTSTRTLGYIIRPNQQTATEIEKIPFAITSAAGCIYGGFWISEDTGNIHYVDEDGSISIAADMAGAYLTGAYLQSWRDLLIQCSMQHNSGKYGTDADMQLVFYAYDRDRSSIKDIGRRLFYKDEGFLHDIAYDHVRKTLYLVMSMQGDENIIIRYGSVEDIVNKTEYLIQLPVTDEGEAKVVYSARDNRLYILNRRGVVFAVDAKSLNLLATLSAPKPFTAILSDPFEDEPVILISDRKEPYILDSGI
jgi:hypothetical protein